VIIDFFLQDFTPKMSNKICGAYYWKLFSLSKGGNLMALFSKQSFGVLEKALSGLNLRNKAISNNIANVDTPNYKREDVSFREELKGAMGQTNNLDVTNKRHISLDATSLNSFQPEVTKEENTSFRSDGNNVSIDSEMAEMAKNSLEYRALVKQVSNQFSRMGSVIQKGGNG